MSKLTPSLMALGFALAAGGCAHHSEKTVVQKIDPPKASWKCPQGLYPDLSQPSPNCLSHSGWTQAQVDQVARGQGKSRISFSCPTGSYPDSTQPMPNCLSHSLNTEAATAGLSGAELDAKLQAARDEGAQQAKQQYEAQLAQQQQQQQQAPENEQKPEAQQAELQKRVPFSTDSAKLTEASKSTLDEIAQEVKSDENVSSIVVDGHADNTGTDQYNEKLSEDRAKSIAAYLEDKGIPAEKIETVAHGADAPIASNENAAGRALNRSAAITAMR